MKTRSGGPRELTEKKRKGASPQPPRGPGPAEKRALGSPPLLRQLRDLWKRLQKQVDSERDRTLPLGDYVVDRFEKARLLGFGEGSSIYDSSLVLGDVRVGKETWIGPFTVLDGSGGLTIGSHCSISAGVHVYTHHTVAWAVSGGKSDPERSPVRIGSRCYIGPHTVIAKGVEIGDGSVIGAFSLVLHDIPAGSKAFGVPCRVVGPAPTPTPKATRTRKVRKRRK